MPIRTPGPAPLEAVRARLVQLLTEIGADAQPSVQRPAMLPGAALQDTVLPRIPASVLRVLVDLAEVGVPLDILTMSERGTRTGLEGSYGRAGGAETTGAQTARAQAANVQVVSALLRALDGGAVGIEDLNLFLGLFAVDPRIIQRAIDGQAGCDRGTVTLNDTVYRLVAGRLVAESSAKGEGSPGLWMKTAAIAALLLLLTIAAIRFG